MHGRTMSRMIFVMIAALLAALALVSLLRLGPALADEPVTQIVYVDVDAAAGGNGQSWGMAYRTLQDALDKANAHGGNCFEIWVAEGVYYPDEDDDGDHVSDAVTETFRISYNNVQLYGGFAGGETARDERNWAANVTVLSGDIDGNDTTNAHGVVVTTTHISGSNAYHVLWLDGETNEPITGSTIIDGFTITAGQADGAWPNDAGGGMYCAGNGALIASAGAKCSPALSNVTFSGNSAYSGGAMYNGGYHGTSSPTLTHVAFSSNSARSDGGAICNDGAHGVSSPKLTDVTFSDNSTTWGDGGAMFNNGPYGVSSPMLISVIFEDNSGGTGGAMYNNGRYFGASSPTLTLVTFSGNSARHHGGAMHNDGEYGASSPTLTSVTFSDNSAGRDGGAMYNNGEEGGDSSPVLTDVTFSSNSAQGDGGAMFNDGEYGDSSPTLTNVSFSDNSAGDDGGAMYNDGADGRSSPTLRNVAFSGNLAERGGAMFDAGYDGGASSPTLTNVTFSGNSAERGGAIYNDGYDYGDSSPALTNVILWGNASSGDGDQMYNFYATPAMGYSLVESGWDGSGIYNDESIVIDNGGNIDADPQFVDAEGGNLRLQSTSLAIDAGDNAAVPADVTIDLAGNPRFVDIPTVGDTGKGTLPIVDMGAYEAQVAGDVRISKSVTPKIGVALQGTITYAVVLDNLSVVSDTYVLFTDTLPADGNFGDWIERPSGAVVKEDVVTWAGKLGAGAAVTFAYRVEYTCRSYGDVLINTAEFSSTLHTGHAQAVFTVEPPVLYVDADATGPATGLSWTNAYTNVQDALDRTSAHGSHRYEVWVAEGIYTPDEDSDGDHTDNDENESFVLSYNNVQLYGGFAGGETAREQRDWKGNVTVLSGDVEGNDTTDAHGVVVTTTNISGSNANHVLWLRGETYEPITGSTVVDGFTITAGQADGDRLHADGGGLYCAGSGSDAECSPALVNVTFSGSAAQDEGGAMFNDGRYGASSPTLTNVTFSGNLAADDGGAMYNDGEYGASSPTLTNVTFSGNSAADEGGAMYGNGRYFGAANPTLTHVTFKGNSAGWGGAMYNDSNNGGASSPTLTNVTFSENSARDVGGAMANSGCDNGTSSPTLTNVTFSGNSAGYDGGAICSMGYDGDSSPTLTNVILWGNRASMLGDQMINVEATPAIGYSLVEGGWDGSGISNVDGGTVTDNGGNIDADPQFLEAAGGNLRLRSTSPAIDAGDNSAVPAGVTTDLDGNRRFVDIPTISDTGKGTPPIVDMGAYEVQSLENRVYLPLALRK